MTKEKEDLKLKYKIWLEMQSKNILGKGGAALLEQIKKHKNLGVASKELGYSYKYAWNKLKKIKEKSGGKEAVITHKGGTGGGGGGGALCGGGCRYRPEPATDIVAATRGGGQSSGFVQ